MRLARTLFAALPFGLLPLTFGAANAQYVYYASPVVQVYGAAMLPMPAQPIAASPIVFAPPAADPRTPVARLQIALTKLGFFQCPITGERNHATNAALASFMRVVPSEIRQRFGNQVAAMAEAAIRQEFPLASR